MSAVKPNKKNIRLWVDALRSGKYQQGQNVLARVNDAGQESFCCLGVACDLSGVAVKRGGSSGRFRFDDEQEYLPESVQEWLGVDNVDPPVTFRGERELLSALNDGYGMSFSAIADAIEQEYLS